MKTLVCILALVAVAASADVVTTNDLLRAVNAYNARAMATIYGADPYNENSVTNWTTVPGPPDGALTWREYGTNGLPTTNAYRTVTRVELVHTIPHWKSHAGFYTRKMVWNPLTWVPVALEDSGARAIWGPYESYTFASMTDAAWNGKYEWSYRTNVLVRPDYFAWKYGNSAAQWRCDVDVYTAGAGKWFYDAGPLAGRQSYGDDMWSGLWFSATATNFQGFGHEIDEFIMPGSPPRFGLFCRGGSSKYSTPAASTVSAYGTMITNLMRDCSILTLTNYALAVTNQLEADLIDWYPGWDPAGESIGYPGEYFYNRTFWEAIESGLSQSSPYIVVTNGGEYTTITNYPLTHTAFPFETNSFFAYDTYVTDGDFFDQCEEAADDRVWTLSGETVGGLPTYGQTVSWTNEIKYWYGYSTNSWAEAVATCEADTPDESVGYGTPYCWTEGTYVGGGTPSWTAEAFASRGKLTRTNYWTGVTKTADFYVYPDQAEGGTFDDQGTGWTEGLYKRVDVVGPNSDPAIQSDWIGTITFPATWCDAPTAGSTHKVTGWKLLNEAIVTKWDFDAY